MRLFSKLDLLANKNKAEEGRATGLFIMKSLPASSPTETKSAPSEMVFEVSSDDHRPDVCGKLPSKNVTVHTWTDFQHLRGRTNSVNLNSALTRLLIRAEAHLQCHTTVNFCCNSACDATALCSVNAFSWGRGVRSGCHGTLLQCPR